MKKNFVLLAGVFFITLQQLLAQNIPMDWKVGMADTKEATPEKLYPADVPGGVHLDYMKATKKDPYYFGTNVKDYRFLESKYWRYKTTFKNPGIQSGQNLVFSSKGIDYEFDIVINGKTILHQEGMFTPVNLVLDDYLDSRNSLEVIIYPIPIAAGEHEGRDQARLVVKPPVPYGWDWHPRLVPVGIWDETTLMVTPEIQILDSQLDYILADDLSTAAIDFHFNVSESNSQKLSYEWTLEDAAGKTVISKKGEVNTDTEISNIPLRNPQLWWPYDHGNPNRYTSTLLIKDADGKVVDEEIRKVGFRKVELVMNSGAWREPIPFPKSRSVAPFTMVINNRFVFAKGSNWVHPELFYGKIDYDLYLEQLLLVKKCNMNMLRIWGGGITNKESFQNICDSLGIMVWHEFPLACNDYPNDSHYLEILEQEAISIIKRIKKHPSLVMWSGGNELFNSWSGMTEQSHALRLLNSLCYQYDKNTPFIYTSPIIGVGHGHYIFYDQNNDEDVFQVMGRARNTAYTEFGMPSLADVDVLKKIIPENELFPVERTESWELHGAFGAWQANSWLEKPTLEKYFGKAESIEDLVWQSQILQSIGYKVIFETGRRQKPYCSMVLNWCFNEPWPNAANNNLVTYPNITKPAFDAVSASLRPVIASASFERFDWRSGQQIEINTWMLNDTYEKVPSGNMIVSMTMDGNKTKIGEWAFDELQENQNLEGPTVRFKVPENIKKQLVKISLEVNENSKYNSDYFLLVRPRRPDNRPVNALNF